jgi:hypothetical protein
MCCLSWFFKKLAEWFAVISITIYSLLTLTYVFMQISLSLAQSLYVNKTIQDKYLAVWGVLVGVVLYVLALACLTATVRLV